MENKELISVIVPVYNVENYLRYSINSILNQTYKNLEIILVNDGSTDKSGEICNEYKEIDDRIKVIHKQNGGLADVRNTGITNANGMYIGFVDSDDYIHPSFFEELYNMVTGNNADIAECDFIRINIDDVDNSKNIIEAENAKKEIVTNTETNNEALELLYGPRLKPYIKKVVVWNKLYKKQLFDNIKFPVGRLHEDEFTTFKVLNNAKTIISTNKIFHGYIQTKNSIMRKEIKQKRITDNLEAYIESSEYFKEHNNINIEMKSRRRYLENCIELSGKVLKENSQDKESKLYNITKSYKTNYDKFIEDIVNNNQDERTNEIIVLLKEAYNSLDKKSFIDSKYWEDLEEIINKTI